MQLSALKICDFFKFYAKNIRIRINFVILTLKLVQILVCELIRIDKKLKKLSNDAKIPVKFCSIYEIVNLREKIVGSMDLEYFRKVFKSSDLIISKENIKEIVDQYNNESSVIESLIRTYQKKL